MVQIETRRNVKSTICLPHHCCLLLPTKGAILVPRHDSCSGAGDVQLNCPFLIYLSSFPDQLILDASRQKLDVIGNRTCHWTEVTLRSGEKHVFLITFLQVYMHTHGNDLTGIISCWNFTIWALKDSPCSDKISRLRLM